MKCVTVIAILAMLTVAAVGARTMPLESDEDDISNTGGLWLTLLLCALHESG